LRVKEIQWQGRDVTPLPTAAGSVEASSGGGVMSGVIGWLQLPPLYLTQEHDFERTSKGHEMGLIAGAHSPSPNHYFLFFCIVV